MYLPRGVVGRRPEHGGEPLGLAEVVGRVPRVAGDLVVAVVVVLAAVEALQDEVVGAGEGVVRVPLGRIQALEGLVSKEHLAR